MIKILCSGLINLTSFEFIYFSFSIYLVTYSHYDYQQMFLATVTAKIDKLQICKTETCLSRKKLYSCKVSSSDRFNFIYNFLAVNECPLIFEAEWANSCDSNSGLMTNEYVNVYMLPPVGETAQFTNWAANFFALWASWKIFNNNYVIFRTIIIIILIKEYTFYPSTFSHFIQKQVKLQ